MKLRTLAAAVAVAALPLAASATTITTIDNQTSIFYNNSDSGVSLGNFDVGTTPLAVNALFTEDNVSGMLMFGVYSSGAPGAFGSIDINVISDNELFSGTFDGQALQFEEMKGDFVASFSTIFDDTSDVAKFVLNFSGFDRGDQFQVNVSAIPLPASVLLLMGALGGLAFVGRRRSA
jgi:hypothetical protein